MISTDQILDFASLPNLHILVTSEQTVLKDKRCGSKVKKRSICFEIPGSSIVFPMQNENSES